MYWIKFALPKLFSNKLKMQKRSHLRMNHLQKDFLIKLKRQNCKVFSFVQISTTIARTMAKEIQTRVMEWADLCTSDCKHLLGEREGAMLMLNVVSYKWGER